MTSMERAVRLAVTGHVEKAFQLLTEASKSNDATASYLLAHWRMAGDLIRRDLAEARRLFGCAADLGLEEAEGPYIALLASGAGNTGSRWSDAVARLRHSADSDPVARRQLSIIDAMQIDCHGSPTRKFIVEQLSLSPSIKTVAGFMTSRECSYIAELAEPKLQPALVVDPVSGRFVRNQLRTSDSAIFPFLLENPFVHAINRRIAEVTSTMVQQGEPLQILSYSKGQEYKVHVDAINNDSNQRTITLLVYMNSDYEGGRTHFPAIDLSIEPKQGDAIFFSNVDSLGNADQHARHAGLPVQRGRKIIMSKWIRKRSLNLDGPPNRPF